MYNHAVRFRTTIRVNESTRRLAEKLAAKYGVTVAYLFDVLVVAFKERSESMPPASSPHRAPARVIDLDTAARERIARRRQRTRFA